MKRFTLTCLAVASTLACAIAAESPRPRYGGTLDMETVTPLADLDLSRTAVTAGDTSARERVAALVFETLVAPNADGTFRPVLATGWESDVRATRWQFTLRRGVILHDGTTLSADDVAAAIGRADRSFTVTVEPDGIIVATDRPRPDLLWELADVGRHAVAVSRGTGTIGTGPFAVVPADSNGALALRAHDRHWAGRPFVERIRIVTGRQVPDQVRDLESGRADLVTIGAHDAARLTGRGLRVVSSPPVDLVALALQPNPAGLARIEARRALSLSIDRQAIADVLLQRVAEPAATLLPQWLVGYTSMFAPAEDRRLARSLVAALPAGRRALTLRFDPHDALERSLAERIVADARDVGLTIALDPAQPPSLKPVDFRLVRIRLDTLLPSRALNRVAPVVHPQVRRLLPAAPDPRAPLDDVYRAERAFLEQYVLIPVAHVRELYGIGRRVESFSGDFVLPSFALDLANVWLRSAER